MDEPIYMTFSSPMIYVGALYDLLGNVAALSDGRDLGEKKKLTNYFR